MAIKNTVYATALFALLGACGASPEAQPASPAAFAVKRAKPTRLPPPIRLSEAELTGRMAAAQKRAAEAQRREPKEKLADLLREAKGKPPKTASERRMLMAHTMDIMQQLPASERSQAVQEVGVILEDPQWLTESPVGQ